MSKEALQVGENILAYARILSGLQADPQGERTPKNKPQS